MDDVIVASQGHAVKVDRGNVGAGIGAHGPDVAGGQKAFGNESAVLDVDGCAERGLDGDRTDEVSAVAVFHFAFSADVNDDVFQIVVSAVSESQGAGEAVVSAAPGVVAFDVLGVIDGDAFQIDAVAGKGNAYVIVAVAKNDSLVGAGANDVDAGGGAKKPDAVHPAEVSFSANFGKTVGAGGQENGVAGGNAFKGGLQIAGIVEGVAGTGGAGSGVPVLDGQAAGGDHEVAAAISVPTIDAEVIVFVAVKVAVVSLVNAGVLGSDNLEVAPTGAGGDDQAGVLSAAFGMGNVDGDLLLVGRAEVEFVPDGVDPALADGIRFAGFQGSVSGRAVDGGADSVSLSVGDVVVRRSVSPYNSRRESQDGQKKKLFLEHVVGP